MSATGAKTAAEVRVWLKARVAVRLGMMPEEVPADQPVTRLGVDSTEAVVISGELQEWLGRRVAPTALWDHPTIDALAEHLAER
ncbi:MAG: acyl carrier protein [Proteobacteria bacterium]|nr:acyl carrier protein [Pseudomonadota bacterium]